MRNFFLPEIPNLLLELDGKLSFATLRLTLEIIKIINKYQFFFERDLALSDKVYVCG